jgi:hypothetical protein
MLAAIGPILGSAPARLPTRNRPPQRSLVQTEQRQNPVEYAPHPTDSVLSGPPPETAPHPRVVTEAAVAPTPGPDLLHSADGDRKQPKAPSDPALPTAKVDSECDLNHDGFVNVVDVQLATNQSLGLAACTPKVNGNICDKETVARIVNASLGGGCVVGARPATSRPPNPPTNLTAVVH